MALIGGTATARFGLAPADAALASGDIPAAAQSFTDAGQSVVTAAYASPLPPPLASAIPWSRAGRAAPTSDEATPDEVNDSEDVGVDPSAAVLPSIELSASKPPPVLGDSSGDPAPDADAAPASPVETTAQPGDSQPSD